MTVRTSLHDYVASDLCDTTDPLASGFDLRSGHQAVTVPLWVRSGDGYEIVRTSVMFDLTFPGSTSDML